MSSSLAERALATLIEFSNTDKTVLAAKLMTLNRFLYSTAARVSKVHIDNYRRWHVTNTYKHGGGAAISSGQTTDAIITALSPLLSDGRVHGCAWSVHQPVDVVADEDDDVVYVRMQYDPCREYYQTQWFLDEPHGDQIIVHTCENNAVVREMTRTHMVDGRRQGTAYKIFRVAPEQLRVTVREYVGGVIILEDEYAIDVSDISQYNTRSQLRKWAVLKHVADSARHDYLHYMHENDVHNMLDDVHSNVPPTLMEDASEMTEFSAAWLAQEEWNNSDDESDEDDDDEWWA